MKRNKLVFISSIASPHQIGFCEALQTYFDTTFLFYDRIGARPKWWQIKLPENCYILKNVFFKQRSKYFTLSHLKYLNQIRPDILMLGGFSIPGNYIAYLWAKFNNVKTIVYTERSRDTNGTLRKKDFMWTILHFLYRNVDLVMVSAEDTAPQFKEFGFQNIAYCPYATDLANYFHHPVRTHKEGYTYLFPNRLTAIYNPLKAIDIFYEIQKLFPNSLLKLNAQGELYQECVMRINDLQIKDNVSFLDEIKSWESMHLIYKESDIMIFPALFSNGNFTIVEAMASGMGMVISDKVLGLGTIIKNNYNGFNCEPETSTFVDCIKQYIANPELFAEHSIINRQIAYEYSAKGVAELFHDTVGKHLPAYNPK